eukprot:SAG22_NODE_5712_length_966_cov_1.346021_1_plen_47_part_00
MIWKKDVYLEDKQDFEAKMSFIDRFNSVVKRKLTPYKSTGGAKNEI